MKLPETQSWKDKRLILNLIAFAVVAIFGALLVGLGAGDPKPTVSLEGEGCGKAEGGVCELVSGEAREVLRDCDQEIDCTTSEYVLGTSDAEGQYVLARAESPFQVVSVYRVDPDTLEYAEVESYFYTPVAESCENNSERYQAECFPYPVSDAQLQDIWESNQGYQEAIERYSR